MVRSRLIITFISPPNDRGNESVTTSMKTRSCDNVETRLSIAIKNVLEKSSLSHHRFHISWLASTPPLWGVADPGL